LPAFNQICIFATYLTSVPIIKFHGVHPQGAAMIGQTDEGTDMAKLTAMRHAHSRRGS